jgi:hypothetical protein
MQASVVQHAFSVETHYREGVEPFLAHPFAKIRTDRLLPIAKNAVQL